MVLVQIPLLIRSSYSIIANSVRKAYFIALTSFAGDEAIPF